MKYTNGTYVKAVGVPGRSPVSKRFSASSTVSIQWLCLKGAFEHALFHFAKEAAMYVAIPSYKRTVKEEEAKYHDSFKLATCQVA